ncbi:MvaI/BcnI family restriction endonuclease [Nitrosopumilus sp.]|nr:MvaI/BcnI family restriction endonuclease [Nitrosopumilus sp.]
MKTYLELIAGLKELKKQGFIKTKRAGNTGIGKTLEDLLGIEENNFAGPDGKDTELKSTRKNSSTMLTLFAKNPLPGRINSKLREEYGYPDDNYPDVKVIRKSLDTTGFAVIQKSPEKIAFKVVANGDRIELFASRPPKKFLNMPNPYWEKEHFDNAFKKKYKKNLLYVHAESKGKDGNEEFHYTDAFLLEGFSYEKFSKNLKDGILIIDIRLGLYNSGPKIGKAHDHGTAFRIYPSKLDKIFTGTKVI